MSKQLNYIIILLLHLATIKANLTVERICRNAKVWTLVPHEQQCEKFYVCTGQKDNSYQEYKCAQNFHFSSQQQRCVRGPCALSCSATGSGTVQRLVNDCTRYKRCSNDGKLAFIRCSYGHYFDAERSVCLPVAITPGHQCSCILPEHSMLPNSQDCSSYYRCEQGRAVLKQCAMDYYYDTSVNSCLLDTRGVCLKALPTPDIDIGEWLPECAGEGSRILPHSHNCSRFFVCLGSQAIELSCPKGQYFDVVSRYCILDENVKCHNAKPLTLPADHVKVQKVIVKKHIKEAISQKQANESAAPELTSYKPNSDVIHNKLASKFLIF